MHQSFLRGGSVAQRYVGHRRAATDVIRKSEGILGVNGHIEGVVTAAGHVCTASIERIIRTKRTERQRVDSGLLAPVAHGRCGAINARTKARDGTGVGHGTVFELPLRTDGVIDAVDFCTNTPLIGESCSVPTGFSVASAASADATDVSDLAANTLRLTKAITAGAVDIEVTGVNNPTAAGALYARIVTYDTEVNADLYTSDGANISSGGIQDYGGVALSITPTIAVSGAVLESMTFCVSTDNIDAANCTKSGGGQLAPPTVKLGRVVDDVTVLDADDVYEGTIYSQISTNAAGGAIVNLKSSATDCGGLVRAGAANNTEGCGILPATDGSDITAGQAKFGVKVGTAAGVSGNTSGTYQIFDTAGSPFYSASVFKIGYAAGNATGTTSTYGDPFLDTNDAPVSNVTMPITFGASANNSTTAGRYSADLSLIATGKF